MEPGATKPETGLIGLGLLGSAIADRLRQAGFRVIGFDADAQRVEEFATAGGEAAQSPSEVFQSCQTVILSLPTSEIVGTVLREAHSLLTSDQIIIDTTTGKPAEMERTAEFLQSLGVQYVEANVAGSSEQMRTGAAALFVAHNSPLESQCKAILNALSPQWFPLGQVGSASRFKLVHNLVLGLNRAVLAEGLTFAESMGFDSAKVLEVLTNTPAASATMQTKGPKMVSSDFEPAARLSQHLKDVRLIIELGASTEASLPLTELHQTLLESAEQLGLGDSDNSAVIEVFRNRSRKN